jgi:DNA-directed RNA polymerase specialized sigma24 family protein
MTDGESDAALSRRVRSGDAEAFGLLIERHMRRAYVHALGIVGSREDALDLVLAERHHLHGGVSDFL